MAAFTTEDPADRAAFDARWRRLLASETVVVRTILAGSRAIGHIARFEMEGRPEVTYWVDRAHWGRGHATRALRIFLEGIEDDEIAARVAADNLGSRRVLEKCGFRAVGAARGFANGRGETIDEIIYIRR